MAEKLKGLIDKANAVIGGLLGDFPQGFNAGAVAGVAGYPGDIAYMLDTAGRAITGQHTQPAAQDFPGTTEYLAAKAGYPVPPSFSGQLGAAIGGVLTPGPGDLAKFAPLSAMFLGAKAKTARPELLDLAQSMESAGKSADEIWQTTGKLGQPWFKGADGKWRFEIPDNQSEMRVDWLDSGRIRPYTLGEVLKHDALYNAHPEIADIPLYPLSKADPWDVDASYSSADDSIHLRFGEQNKFTAGSVPRTGGNPSLEEIGDARSPSSAFLHEIQHAAQDREAFSRGGTPKDASASAFDEYKKLAGEAEARNVQARMNMSMDERIALPPWLTQDVPTDQQIVRFGDGPAMAIPFWHGSPHKYDAVDLSKIGTGEGAQAYGWGYYGAQAKDTAEAYQNALSAPEFYIGNNKADPFIGADEATALALSRIFSSDPAMHTGKLNAEHFDKARRALEDESIYLGNEKLSKLASDAAEKIDGLKSQFLDSSAEFRMGGNMYRGEYRWPDPAKEAATPLTGEDLLDWDKPLSEQSPSVRNAADAALTALYPNYEKYRGGVERAAQLKREIVETAKRYEGPGDSGKSWRDLISKAPDDVQKEWSAKVQEFRTLEEDLPAIPQSGESLVRAAEETLGNAEASAFFQSLGIPGTRYKDQMSRGSEGGTYNYVMFQDKGIKLLERNGEPIPAAAEFAARREGKPKPYREAMGMDQASRMERAREMGFTTDAYHGTADDVTAFDPAKFGSSTGAHSAKQGVWTVSDPKTAGGYAQYALLGRVCAGR